MHTCLREIAQPNDILIRRNTLSLTSLTLTFCPWSRICYPFFRERNQPNLTLVVFKFYSGLRNLHYHERLNLVSACVPQLRFLYLCCLLWFDSSVLYSVEFTVQCRCLQIPLSCSIQKHQQNFHLETELDAKNLQICMNVCAFIQRSQMFV